MEWVNAVVQGILLGGIYALFAAGLSLMFGVMRIVNLAHGALAILAAYLAVLASEHLGLGAFATLIVVVPAMFAVGYLLQRGVLNFSMESGELGPLLATFGLAIVIANGLQEAFSVDQKGLSAGSIEIESIRINSNISVGWVPLISLIAAVAIIAGLQLLLNRTRIGRAFRASSDDPEAAEIVGINQRALYALAAGIAIASVAVAGVLLGIQTSFAPFDGNNLLLFGFEAVIIGGLGNLWGTLIGGIVIGVAQTVGAQIEPSYSILAGDLVFLAVLVARPSGLLPRTAP